MNEQELEHVVASLRDFVGVRLQNTWQPRRDRVVLGFADGRYLLMVPRGPWARIHSARGRPKNPQRPFSFQGAGRAHLSGPLLEIEKTPGERIVNLVFGEHRLHLRLTGRSGGLWLLSSAGVIAAYDGPAPAALPLIRPHELRRDPPRFQPAAGETWDQAARGFFESAERRQLLEERRIVLHRGLRRQLNRALRLCEHLGEDLDRASQAPRLRAMADNLAAYLHLIPRGAAVAELPDLDDPERTVHIPVDPAQPPVATMERMYKKARRLDRVGDRVLERMDDVEARIAVLEEALSLVQTADGPGLAELMRLLPREGDGRCAPSATHYVTWEGPQAERILVGRNSSGNRRLTFQTARGHDFWLHVRGKPGAHVVIPLDRDKTPALELLLAAAQIALVHGKIQEGARADVQYTRVRNVRSIPGDPGGRVLLSEEKVLHITRDPSVLIGWKRS